jgi:DMSO reductase anchor subunit
MPPAESTISTTRITRPEPVRADFRKADYHRVRPEHPHWPLVFMLVLTQMSVGAFLSIVLLAARTGAGALQYASIAALAIGHLALGASTLHLGRPAFAWRALKMWKRSWLSREVVAFTAFAGAATLYAGLLWLSTPIAPMAGIAACIAGVFGVLSSAFIYLVPARPAWNSWTTPVEYFLTAALLGAMFARCFSGDGTVHLIAISSAVAITILAIVKVLRLRLSSEFELRQSARLLVHDLRRVVVLRFTLLAIAIGCLITGMAWAALLLCMASEIAGRYLFFVSVVPRNMAASFFTSGAEAA